MDEICNCVKTACDVEDFEKSDGCCEYIEFKACEEEQDWTDAQLADYVRSELKTHLGDDVANIDDVVIHGKIIIRFSYKGHWGEIWETYNSRGYHYWVISI
jgi:hypothetical protein